MRCKVGVAVLALLLAVPLAGVGYLYLQHRDFDSGSERPTPRTGVAASGYEAPIAAASEHLGQSLHEMAVPSLSVAVAHRGKLVWSEAVGLADIDSGRMVDTETRYAIGSISKPITAVAAMRLAERGLLDLDRDVRDYVPGFPEKSHPITARQLLSHQSGIRHYGFAMIPPTLSEANLNRNFATTDEALAIFANDPLEFQPDTGFTYSTYGYTLLSAAMEKATDKPFLTIIDEEVFGPASMEHSSTDRAADMGQNRAKGYAGAFPGRKLADAAATDSSYKWAGGGLASTPSDLARFGAAMLAGELVGGEWQEDMLTARTLASGEVNEQSYGLGWRIGGIEVDGQSGGAKEWTTLIHHGGNTAGSTAILLLLPDYDLVVALTANAIRDDGSGPVTEHATSILRIFVDYLDESGMGRGRAGQES